MNAKIIAPQKINIETSMFRTKTTIRKINSHRNIIHSMTACPHTYRELLTNQSNIELINECPLKMMAWMEILSLLWNKFDCRKFLKTPKWTTWKETFYLLITIIAIKYGWYDNILGN